MFPTGWPGVGLLMLRIGVAAKALGCAYAVGEHLLAGWASISLKALATVVLVGILTPIASVLQILVELAVALSLGALDINYMFVSTPMAAGAHSQAA